MDAAFKSVGVLTTDRELVVRSWDHWLTEATGIAAADACGKPLGELAPELAARGLLGRLSRVLQLGTVEVLAPAFHHYLIPCPPREPASHFGLMQQHVILSPLREGDSVTGVVVTIEDVTQRLERERELAAQLRSEDEAIRLRAARTLADESSHAVLVDAFSDERWTVREAAIEGFRLSRAEEATAALMKALRDQHDDLSVLNATLSALAAAGGDVVPGLIEHLSTGGPDVRVYAALALGHLADRRAVEALLDALEDPDANVRYHAIEALGRVGAYAAADKLADVALSGDFFLAFAALDSLAQVGEESVAARLLPLLADAELAEAAVETLGAIGAEDVVAPVASALERSYIAPRVVAEALARLHARFEAAFGEGDLIAQLARPAISAAGARRLVAELTRADDRALAHIALVLGWLDFDGIASALTGLLAHDHARPPALEALVRRGGEALDVLIRELKEGTLATRKSAAAALARIGSPLAVPALVEQLSAPPELAVVAASALGSIGHPDAFEPLLPLLEHEDASVRQSAVGAINSIGHPDTESLIERMLLDDSPRIREAAARIAGYFGYEKCLEGMTRLCADPDPLVRRVAIEHMSFFRDARAVAAVTQAVADPSPTLRAAAVRAMALMPASDVRDAVAAGLADSDPWVRYYAARAAGALRDATLLEPLCVLVSADEAPPVRIAAMEALGRSGDERGIGPLAAAAQHEDLDISVPALEALARIGSRGTVPHFRSVLRDSSPAHQLAAVRALTGSPQAAEMMEDVRALAATATPEITEAAIHLLVGLGSAEGVTAVTELARDPTRRATCAIALSRVSEDLIDVVARALEHEDAEVRRTAVEALARRKHPTATRYLATALADPDPKVRLAAARALGRMDLRSAELRRRGSEATRTGRPAFDALVR